MGEFDIKKFAEDLKKIAKEQFDGVGKLANAINNKNLSNYTKENALEPKASFLFKLAEQNIDINKLLTGKSYQDSSIEERLSNLENSYKNDINELKAEMFDLKIKNEKLLEENEELKQKLIVRFTAAGELDKVNSKVKK